MTDAKHTVAPWEACKVGDYGDYDGRCIVILGDDLRICVVLGDHEEANANARLIAAAPELLEALEAAVDELFCVRDYIDDASRGQLRYRGESDLSEMAGGDLVRIDEKNATARAAIAKAKGEAQ